MPVLQRDSRGPSPSRADGSTTAEVCTPASGSTGGGDSASSTAAVARSTSSTRMIARPGPCSSSIDRATSAAEAPDAAQPPA